MVQIKKLHDYLKKNYSDFGYEMEISIDETDTVTTPFEHFFIVNEMKRLNVEFVSLAPRFIGGFEKGIDYKGNIETFKKEYLKHAAISDYLGFYKLSFHSGSDKFSVYDAVADLKKGIVHVKTAGTSYLEALKVLAVHYPETFKEILDYSKNIYEEEKRSYHVSADINKIKSGKEYKDDELVGLFNVNDVRQVLHVAYGKILTDKTSDGKYIFRDKIYDCLNKHEDTHYKFLIRHFNRHLDPLSKFVS
jgi:tagaturonate epimerase